MARVRAERRHLEALAIGRDARLATAGLLPNDAQDLGGRIYELESRGLNPSGDSRGFGLDGHFTLAPVSTEGAAFLELRCTRASARL